MGQQSPLMGQPSPLLDWWSSPGLWYLQHYTCWVKNTVISENHWRITSRVTASERVKFNGHQGLYKPYNHNIYTGIIIFPHIDDTKIIIHGMSSIISYTILIGLKHRETDGTSQWPLTSLLLICCLWWISRLGIVTSHKLCDVTIPSWLIHHVKHVLWCQFDWLSWKRILKLTYISHLRDNDYHLLIIESRSQYYHCIAFKKTYFKHTFNPGGFNTKSCGSGHCLPSKRSLWGTNPIQHYNTPMMWHSPLLRTQLILILESCSSDQQLLQAPC